MISWTTVVCGDTGVCDVVGIPEGRGPVASLFELGKRTLLGLTSAVEKERVRTRAFLRGRLDCDREAFESAISRLEADHPVTPESPFEGSNRVAGSVWRASEVLGESDDGGLLKLHFKSNATDLALHTHDHSERFIVVHSGSGVFRAEEGGAVRDHPVQSGDIIAFTRGLLHTFVSMEGMTLLSWHFPFFELDDPRQWTRALD